MEAGKMKRLKMKGKMKWIIITAVVLIVVIAAVSAKTGGVSADTVKVSKGEIKQYVEGTAEVTPHEKQTVYIEGSGKIVDVKVDTGSAVKKGDLLLSLDRMDLELQLKDAEAKVEASKAQLKGTDIVNYANKIELAKAAVDQAQVSCDSAKRSYENAKNMYASQAISKTELDKAQDDYKKAQAALDTANLQLSDLKQGTPDYVKSGYQSQLEQAVIYRDTIQKNLQKQEVRAGMDGIVIEKLVQNNSPAAAGTAAFVIGSTGRLELEADILADDINKVKIGNLVEISGKPIGDAVLKGKVTKIAPAAKTIVSNLGINQKRVPVTIEITDDTNALKPGYNMDVKIVTDAKNDAIKVPDTAVFDYKGSSRVFALENGKAVLRTVKKGIESDNSVEIVEGLKQGDIILVKPDNNITEGTKIKPLSK